MQICQQTTENLEQQVERWIEETTTNIEQACETIVRQVEQWEEQWETRCTEQTQQVCNTLPWPLSALCSWVTMLVCNLVLAVVRILRPIATVLCNLITTLIRTLKRIITILIVIAIKVVCLFVPALPDTIEDIVPDLTGVNFDRRDADGNLVPFIWGVATASHQVEGGIEHSDWHRFTISPSIKKRVERVGSKATTLRLEPPERAIDHWNLDVIADDLDRAKLLGMNAYRFSLEWSRIQPNKPDWVVQHNQKLWEAQQANHMAQIYREDNRILEAEAEEARAQALISEAEAIADAPADPNDFDPDALGTYRAMVDELMQERGLKPILTLNHMSLPDWVLTPPVEQDVIGLGALEDQDFHDSLRGWENAVTVKAFAKFVQYVVPYFSDDVSHWVTLNEPVGSMIGAGYLGAVFPPGFLGDGDRGRRVYFNLIEAHIRAYDIIKELAGQEAKVGFAHYVAYARKTPQTLFNRIIGGDNEAAKNQWVFAVNTYFLDAVIKGEFNVSIWRKDTPRVRDEWKGKVDFIAPQYYRAVDIYHDKLLAPRAPWWGGLFVVDLRQAQDDYLRQYLWNDLGWTIHPGGLYRVLNDLYTRYRLPILITENGMAEAQDRNRASFTIAHLQQVLRAIKDGIDVIGYIHWTIVDNWEWAFGYLGDARFGLFTVDRTVDLNASGASSFPRHITEGALALQYVLSNSRRITQSDSNDNPLAEPVARFGTITPDGLNVQLPEKIAGGFWEGRFDPDGPTFTLYLSRLPEDNWLGMIFFHDTQQWVRLHYIGWRHTGDQSGELRFNHVTTDREGQQVQAAYVARTVARSSGADATLTGMVKVGDPPQEKEWRAKRVSLVGVWRPESISSTTPSSRDPVDIAVNRFEGDSGGWSAKVYGMGKPNWKPTSRTTAPGDSELELRNVNASPFGFGSFRGRVVGETLSGTFTISYPIIGQVEQNWKGKRLPDDIAF